MKTRLLRAAALLLCLALLAGCKKSGQQFDENNWLVFENDPLRNAPVQLVLDLGASEYRNYDYFLHGSFSDMIDACDLVVRVTARKAKTVYDESLTPYRLEQFTVDSVLRGNAGLEGLVIEVLQLAAGPVRVNNRVVVSTNGPQHEYLPGGAHVLCLWADDVGRYHFPNPWQGMYVVEPGGAINPMDAWGLPFSYALL